MIHPFRSGKKRTNDLGECQSYARVVLLTSRLLIDGENTMVCSPNRSLLIRGGRGKERWVQAAAMETGLFPSTAAVRFTAFATCPPPPFDHHSNSHRQRMQRRKSSESYGKFWSYYSSNDDLIGAQGSEQSEYMANISPFIALSEFLRRIAVRVLSFVKSRTNEWVTEGG